MELYSELKKLGKHLISIRRAEMFYFIDLKFPKTWLINQKLFEEKKVVPFSLKNSENETGISFVAEDNSSEFGNVMNTITNLINRNIEIEKKNELLNISIEKLKLLFNKSKLDDLKNLEFSINTKDLEHEDTESTKVDNFIEK
ncbi:MAG: hypothetical protein K9I82_02360 [Chitinophagaceae bacterium]|nr:hypothetical protein [Chitinophagaceae bacterium]